MIPCAPSRGGLPARAPEEVRRGHLELVVRRVRLVVGSDSRRVPSCSARGWHPGPRGAWPTLEEVWRASRERAPESVRAQSETCLARSEGVRRAHVVVRQPSLLVTADHGVGRDARSGASAGLQASGAARGCRSRSRGSAAARMRSVDALVSWREREQAAVEGRAGGAAIAAYGHAIVARARVDLASQAEEQARSELTWFEARVEAGDATAVDRSLAQTELARYAQLRAEAQIDLAEAQADLRALTGLADVGDPPADVEPPCRDGRTGDAAGVGRCRPAIEAFERERTYWDRQADAGADDALGAARRDRHRRAGRVRADPRRRGPRLVASPHPRATTARSRAPRRPASRAGPTARRCARAVEASVRGLRRADDAHERRGRRARLRRASPPPRASCRPRTAPSGRASWSSYAYSTRDETSRSCGADASISLESGWRAYGELAALLGVLAVSALQADLALLRTGLAFVAARCALFRRSAAGRRGVASGAARADARRRDAGPALRIVAFDPAVLGRLGIRVEAAGTSGPAHTVRVSGTLDYDLDHYAEVGALLEGRVASVTARVGDRVKKGQVLATLVVPSIAEAQAELPHRPGRGDRGAQEPRPRDRPPRQPADHGARGRGRQQRRRQGAGRPGRGRGEAATRSASSSRQRHERRRAPGRYSSSRRSTASSCARDAVLGGFLEPNKTAFVVADLSSSAPSLEIFEGDLPYVQPRGRGATSPSTPSRQGLRGPRRPARPAGRRAPRARCARASPCRTPTASSGPGLFVRAAIDAAARARWRRACSSRRRRCSRSAARTSSSSSARRARTRSVRCSSRGATTDVGRRSPRGSRAARTSSSRARSCSAGRSRANERASSRCGRREPPRRAHARRRHHRRRASSPTRACPSTPFPT